MNSVITLTTDFGDADGYVASVKGVILGINPAANIVDISHRIQPQNVHQAAFVLGTSYAFFPKNTVHLAVVDPAVGTNRRIVILRTPEGTFIGPDNGVLSYAFKNYTARLPDGEQGQNGLISLTEGASAVQVTNRRFFREPVSATFHGRDIMAPVAALLSQGFQPETFGNPVDRLVSISLTGPAIHQEGIIGHVIHIDHFGNIVTDIRQADLPEADFRLDIGGHPVSGMKHSYTAAKGLLALIGSAGYLEIALFGSSAAAITGARIGDEVKIGTGV